MPLTFYERVSNLFAAQGGNPNETLLLNCDVDVYERHSTRHPGANDTYVVVLRGAGLAFHKSFSGISPTLAALYGQSQETAPVHECAAWRLAVALGHPFTSLVPPCVRRNIHGNEGSLTLGVTGDPIVPSAFDQVPDQADAAAFFDSVIAQQDRHRQNYRWEASVRQFHLIDHGFCFAQPGSRCNASVFVEWRWRVGRQALAESERQHLHDLLNSPDVLGLALFLEEARVVALRSRAERMLQMGTILPRSQF